LDAAAAKVMALEIPTRADVVHELGDPDASVDFGRVFIYRWTSTKMAVLLAAGAGYSGAATIEDWPINNFILFEFDAAGRVKRWERRKAPTGVSGEDYLLRLCRDW
jgi:hypothetical protein